MIRVALVLSMLLAGCTVGPNYQPPRVAVPVSYAQASAARGVTPDAPLAEWWTAFQDTELNSLIERATQSNLDLRIASLRVVEARASLRLARSALLPSMEQSDSASRLRGGFSQGVVRLTGAPGASGSSLIAPFDTGIYQGGFDARWELDLAGGQRRAVEAARADASTVEEARRVALVSLEAEVARDYVELRGLQRRLDIARGNIEAERDELQLTRGLEKAGLATGLDVEKRNADLSLAEAAIPVLEAAKTQLIGGISVLLAEPAEKLNAELLQSQPLPNPPGIPVGFPSDLLRRRPDIREAEAEVAAASARVGVATADLYPKFTLLGWAGRQAATPAGLTLGGGNFFGAGPAVQLPIFTGGRVRANIAVRDARLDESLARYEKTVLEAVEEVETALAAYGREQERRTKIQTSLEARRAVVEIAREMYTHGLGDYFAVLDSQVAVNGVDDTAAESDVLILRDTIAIMKTLGGGWDGTGTAPNNFSSGSAKKP